MSKRRLSCLISSFDFIVEECGPATVMQLHPRLVGENEEVADRLLRGVVYEHFPKRLIDPCKHQIRYEDCSYVTGTYVDYEGDLKSLMMEIIEGGSSCIRAAGTRTAVVIGDL